MPVAALQPGAGHQPGGADLVAVELGQAVDRLGLQVERAVRVAVPVRVDRRVAQAEVGGEVDDLQVRGSRAITSWLVACGRAQKTRSIAGEVDRLDRGQRAAARGGAGAGRPRPCVCPALRSAVSAAIAQAAGGSRSAARARRRYSRWRRGSRRRRPRPCPRPPRPASGAPFTAKRRRDQFRRGRRVQPYWRVQGQGSPAST